MSGSELENCYETFKKLARNSEYSESTNSKKLSVLAQILAFLTEIPVETTPNPRWRINAATLLDLDLNLIRGLQK